MRLNIFSGLGSFFCNGKLVYDITVMYYWFVRPLRTLCIWIEAAWLLCGGGRHARTGRTAVWIFLGSGRLPAKSPGFEGWKSLDFLDSLVRNRAFSKGYTGFSPGKISRAPFAPAAGLGRGATILTCRKGRIDHGGSLTIFLIFRNIFPPSRFLLPRTPKCNSLFAGLWRLERLRRVDPSFSARCGALCTATFEPG